jgi:transcription antitermination factor NusG
MAVRPSRPAAGRARPDPAPMQDIPNEAATTGRAIGARRWYAVSVLPGGEARAELNLARQGFSPFVPRHHRTVRHARRLTVRRAAFFPGYMFLPLDLSADRWRAVNGTLGVRSLVMQGERPVPCPEGLVEAMISATGADGLLDFSAALDPGAPVRLASGPFADTIGVLERLDSAGRARVLIAIMNGEVAVSVAAKDVLAA